LITQGQNQAQLLLGGRILVLPLAVMLIHGCSGMMTMMSRLRLIFWILPQRNLKGLFFFVIRLHDHLEQQLTNFEGW
jgi:hypothetical protein